MPAPSSDVSPYDRLYWPDELLLRSLANGEHRRELLLYFGHDGYAELAALARRAFTQPPCPTDAEVWLIPGIMGSQLGLPRPDGQPPDLIWLDPVDVMRGDLYKLRLTADSPVRALGLVHQSYLRLWLRLLGAGFRTRVFPYDWRRDVRASGELLAAALAATTRPAMLVAHSLGGLVARAALSHPAASGRVTRVVQLGTPNNGAAGARMALNGCYPVVRRTAMLDRLHDAQQLSTEVFASFESVRQLLPESIDERATLAKPDARYRIVAGTGQITCDEARFQDGDWHYRFTRSGDGTVSLESARLEGAPCYLTATEHSDLSRSAAVAAAVIDLLQTGSTSRLPAWQPALNGSGSASASRYISQRTLVPLPDSKIDWGAWTPEARREFLEHLNAPLPVTALAGF